MTECFRILENFLIAEQLEPFYHHFTLSSTVSKNVYIFSVT